MAAVTGQLNTYNVGNYLGPLYMVTPNDTPFLNMIGANTPNGGKQTSDPEFGWQTVDLPAASQDTKLEGADATFSGRTRTPATNITQIHQEGVEVSYTKLAAWAQLAKADYAGHVGGAAFATAGGNQPVMNELTQQVQWKMAKIKRDLEYSFLQGVYQRPTTNATDRQTRGILTAITSNTVAAAGAAFSTAQIDQLILAMFNNGAPLSNLVIMANGFQKQKITQAYGSAPQDRNVGGVNIQVLELDLAGRVGIVVNRHMPTDTIGVFQMDVIHPVWLPTPGKGAMFTEPLAKTGSAEKVQIYTEVGLEYGLELWHGKITGLATA